MTDKEVIKGLQAVNEHIGKHFNEGGAWMAEFIDNAIKLLEQPPCEDAISREEALKVMCDKCPMYNCVTGCSSYRHIEKMPSVTPQPKTGHWEELGIVMEGRMYEHGECDMQDAWGCDYCGYQVYMPTKYCPNCGAKMEVE